MSRTRLHGTATAVTVAALALTAVSVAPAAAALERHRDGHHAPTRQAMDAAVAAGAPGVVGQVRDARGVWTASSGVADRDTGRPRVGPEHFRAGSITKTFVATVVLQLEAERRLSLDDTVERWLPGMVRGNGHDGRKITVRRLLNHTSGIHDYTRDPEFERKTFKSGFPEHRYDTYDPRELVRIAMGHEPAFAPGAQWGYSNTNYILAGLIIEKVTGRPYATEVERRITEPLGLRSTVLPGTRARMPQPHGRAYQPVVTDTELFDVTELNPSTSWAAGEVISTVDDLNRFYRALLRGELLTEAGMAEMFTTVPMGVEAAGRYGLGIYTTELSCGVRLWGHGGSSHGSNSAAFGTRDGRHTAVFHINARGPQGPDNRPLMEAEFCGGAAKAPQSLEGQSLEGVPYKSLEKAGRSLDAPRNGEYVLRSPLR